MKKGIRLSLIISLVFCAARNGYPQDVGARPAEAPAVDAMLTAGEDLDSPAAVIELFNRDRMRGRLIGIDPEEGFLTWLNPLAHKPIRFRLDAVQRLILPDGAVGRADEGLDAIVTENGDHLYGRLVGIDADTVTLETGYVGNLTFRRDMVAQVLLSQPALPAIYSGPRSLTQWEVAGEPDGWALENNTFVARVNAPMGRRFDELPDRCYIAFDMEWEGALNATFGFFMEDPLPPHGIKGYRLIFSRNIARLATSGDVFPAHPNFRSDWDGVRFSAEQRHVTMRSGMGPGSTRVELFVDREAGSITLVLDRGLLKQTWSDLDPSRKWGNAIVFIPQDPGVMKFGNIRIETWDGETFERREVQTAVDRDILLLRNGDILSGRVLSMMEGIVRFDASFSTFEVALAKVAELLFASEAQQQAPIKPGDARAGLAGAGHMTLRRVQVTEGTLTGSSEIFGEVSFPTALLQSLFFHRDGE